MTAHEDERRRLARDLHDDVTQRLAALAIQTSKLERAASAGDSKAALQAVSQRLVELSEDVHGLSYRLHPTVIEDLGLAEALRAECERVASSARIDVRFASDEPLPSLPADVAVGLFRIAQEALRNVVKHSQAAEAHVTLGRLDQRVVLEVKDSGIGFERAGKDKGASLGLASMRERMRLLGGELRVESAAGRGTTVMASVPLTETM